MVLGRLSAALINITICVNLFPHQIALFYPSSFFFCNYFLLLLTYKPTTSCVYKCCFEDFFFFFKLENESILTSTYLILEHVFLRGKNM